MRNVKFNLLIAFAVVGTLVLNACTDPGVTPEPDKPVLNFLSNTGYISADGEITEGSEFTVGIQASHSSNIESLKVRVSLDGSSQVTPDMCTLCDTTFKSKTLTVDFTNMVQNKVGYEEWFFTVADKDGNETTRSIKLTRTSTPKPVRAVDATLGNQKAAEGSSLNLTDFTVYNLTDATANSASVDLVYVLDETNSLHIVGAPSSSRVQSIMTKVATWTTKNATEFRKTSYSATQFNAMTTSEKLNAEIASTSPTSNDVDITGGSVYFVKPASSTGRYALMLIKNIGTDNTINVSVLVEDN
ncbi:MAG: hypothetical protein H6607_10590 [Flavobacteriales bacterium]|nr:hypothetical protein [Flavobacteriales bacterium]